MEARKAERRTILAGASGNIMEWYDFAVYGTLAPILGKQFFPADDEVASLLAAFVVFAVGFAVRPLGGVLIGHIGDRLGRKPALMLSVVIMGLATTAMGLLPTHAEIGTAAAVLLVLLRIVQGLSVGGEYPSSIVFLAEHAPARRRGYFASWPMLGSVIGFLLGSAIVALLNTLLGDVAMEAWGWRIPFIAGFALTIFGYAVRRSLDEPEAFGMDRSSTAAPAVIAVRDHWTVLLRIVGLSLVNAVGFYLLAVYAASYLTERMHVSTKTALDVNTLSLVVMVPAVLLAAILSDRIGRKPILYFTAVGTLLLAWPLWWLMHHQNFWLILAGQAGLAVLYGAGYAGLSAVMVEMLPTNVRCSATSLGYNICMALFGGTTPLIATWLVARTADDFTPAYYLMATALISLVVTIGLKETAGRSLSDPLT